jgi:transcription initiation factor TFIIE subunit beta
MRQKQVVDFLRKRESPATATEIAVATGREIQKEPDLASALDANPKIEVDVDAGTFAYLPEANVRNREQLLDYICRAGAPVATSELADAYRTVLDDVAALKNEGLVLGLHSFDPEINCEVLYAVDKKLAGIECDPEVAALWLSTDVPDDDEEVVAELQKVNLPHVPRKAPRKTMPKEKKRRQRKASKLRAVTNAHLMHLLEGDGPTAIDNV